nr:hypothetical protein Iba_chr12cCG2860 [Ipomoea batatas]
MRMTSFLLMASLAMRKTAKLLSVLLEFCLNLSSSLIVPKKRWRSVFWVGIREEKMTT